ncbi:MAG: PH domain-containing protein [Bacilli bacterium]|nr:PH domain-containing protein [Bacilli bacterium]
MEDKKTKKAEVKVEVEKKPVATTEVKKVEETKKVEPVKEEATKTITVVKEKTKNKTNLDDVEFNILWQGKPCGLLQRFLTKIHLNFTTYQITKDELIIITGFFKRRLNSYELFQLKDPDLSDTIYQRLLDISTVSVTLDTHDETPGCEKQVIKLKNIQDGSKVRKLLRDAIERDVMDRQITYLNKV